MSDVVSTTSPKLPPDSGINLLSDSTGILGWMDHSWVFRTALSLIALLYIGSLTPNWYHTPDSALYLMLGENLAHGDGYTLWGKPHVHVPPGFPLLLAGLNLIGVESTLGKNIFMMLLAWGTLGCVYLALRELVPLSLARWLVLLVALGHVMHHTSVCLLSDIPFMFLVWLGLWCQLKGLRTGSKSLEIGTCLLLASCAFRVVGVPIAIGASMGLLLQQSQLSRKRLWTNAIGTVLFILLVIGTAVIYIYLLSKNLIIPSYGREAILYLERLWNSGFNRAFFNVLTSSPELSTLLTGQKNRALGFFILLIWAPFIIGATVAWRRRQTFGVCLLLCYILPLILLRPLIARYFLPLSPFIFWYTLEGLRWLGERTLQWQPRGKRIAFSCALLLLLINVPKAGKLAYRLHNPKIDNSYKEQRHINEVAAFLSKSGSTQNVFITNSNGRILSYLSGRWTIPDAERRLRYDRPSPDLLKKIGLSSASHFVLQNCGNRKTYTDLKSLVSTSPGSKLVFESESFKIFQLEPLLATANHSNSHLPDNRERK